MTVLAENRYGKSRVRLVRVNREREQHDFCEWTVEVLLQGDFGACFTEGDNRGILPTDTIKNTVYSLARSSGATCMEELAKELIDFLLQRNSQIQAAEVSISEKTWEHLSAGGRSYPSAFVQTSGERQTAEVSRSQAGNFSVRSGLENLVIMKTGSSAFEGFIRDHLTTLPEASDRLLGTAARATWKYSSADVALHALRPKIREILLTVFAAHESKSVQHTLYAMGEAVLEQVPQVEDIELSMPNLHCLLVDLSRFGQDNPNKVFMPIDEPHGYIEARLCRK